MRFQNPFFILIFTLSFLFSGCTGGEIKKPSNKKRLGNTTSGIETAKTNNPLNTEKPAPRKEINKATRLKPVVSAYCAAIIKGDDVALKNILSKNSWKTLSADAREEGQKSVAGYLNESEPIGNKCSVINEQISGSIAVAVVTTQTYPNGVQLKFVKETGEWKMTTESTDFDTVKKGSEN